MNAFDQQTQAVLVTAGVDVRCDHVFQGKHLQLGIGQGNGGGGILVVTKAVVIVEAEIMDQAGGRGTASAAEWQGTLLDIGKNSVAGVNRCAAMCTGR